MGFRAALTKINQLVAELDEEHEKEITALRTRIGHQEEMLTKFRNGDRVAGDGLDVDMIQFDETQRAPFGMAVEKSKGLVRHKRLDLEKARFHGWQSECLADGGSVVDVDAEIDASGSPSSQTEVQKMSSLITKGAEVHLNSNESDGPIFALKDSWSKVPVATDAFLDEVDEMLVQKNASAMYEQRESGERAQNRNRVTEIAPRRNSVVYSALHCIPMINPTCQKRIGWDVAGMALICYDMVALPIQLCFDETSGPWSEFMGWVTLLFWTMDMVFSCFTGFYRDGDLIMKQSEILWQYVKGWFWVDCIVVVPDWIMKAMGSVTSAAGLGRVLRVARVFRVLRLLRLLKLKRLFNIVYDLIDSEVMFIMFTLIKLLVMIVFMNHVVACAWYLVGKIGKDSGGINWLEDVGQTPVWGKSFLWKYLTSLHWSITQFTPASMDIYAVNDGERLFSVLILFWALVALSSIIGSISASVMALRNMTADENKQFWVLRRYLKQKKIHRSLTTRILSYVEHQQIAKHNQVSASSVRLLGLMSEQLHLELSFELFSPYLSDHPFFQYMTRDDTMLNSMERLCIKALRTFSHATDEVCFTLGDEALFMYFVKEGEYEYVLLNDQVMDVPLSEKLWVSEAVLWTTWRHRGWLKATGPSEVLALSPDKFVEVLHLHPKPWYLAMHYGVDFVNYLNRTDLSALTDVIFEAEVWVSVVKDSDTYVLKRKRKISVTSADGDENVGDTEAEYEVCIGTTASDTNVGDICPSGAGRASGSNEPDRTIAESMIQGI